MLLGTNRKNFYTPHIKIGKVISATDRVTTDDIEGDLVDLVEKNHRDAGR